jgi:YYY domain-containing protein
MVPKGRKTVSRRDVMTALILLGILVLAAYLRYEGVNWDEYSHNHPDERFLTMVEGAIQPVDSFSEYFNTATSRLNPHNVGHTHFVYGTLPIFFIRYLAQGLMDLSQKLMEVGIEVKWLTGTYWIGYNEIHLLGRTMAATFDLITVFIVYLIGSRLYRRRVGLLAAAFAATSVLLIQQSHFFVVDSYANTFIMAGIYFAVRVLDSGRLREYVFFGLALGMAVASKISAFPLAGAVAIAAVLRAWSRPEGERLNALWTETRGLMLAAFISLLTFRILQPYAFQGTSFLDVRLNPAWLDDLREQSAQSTGVADSPPAWQWADRTPIWFSLKNMILWGLGPLLGITAWASWGWALYRMVKGDLRRHSIPVVWTGVFFIWQSTSFTSAMRYQLPVYPTLALLAAWGMWETWKLAGSAQKRRKLWQAVVAAGGIVILLATTLWAFAFTSIYTRPLTRVDATRWIFNNIPGSANLVVQTADDSLIEPVPLPQDFTLNVGAEYTSFFTSHLDGTVSALSFPYVSEISGLEDELWMRVTLTDEQDPPVSVMADYRGTIPVDTEEAIELALDTGFVLRLGHRYSMRLELFSGGTLGMRGSIIVAESSWDDALPMRFDDRDGFGGYYSGRNLELYWPDNQDSNGDGIADKVERIAYALDDGDYLSISSNRQYGSIGRINSRFPLTIAYYRALLGCEPPDEIWECAMRAEVGETQGDLGYELIAVFRSNPRVGPLEINDQGAEEAFTVYDHPQVMIFAKQDHFSAEHVYETLARVNLQSVVNVPPGEAVARQLDLMLPAERLEQQRTGGTWSELYPTDSLINRSNLLAIVVWYLLIGVIGILVFPLVRVAFGGLRDGGYPLSRLVGLLLVAWGTWMLGSFRVPFMPATILFVLLALVLLSALIAWRDRQALMTFFREKWKEIVWTEVLGLGFFLLLLFIRTFNGDLWHPSRGGEKPMDLAYFNAVLKSTSFPPYDPWFSGGYINYYYFGFVLVGVPVKLLGLVPTFAYNLILPTLFSMLALAAYSVGFNLTARFSNDDTNPLPARPRLAGLAAALGMVLLGNLGTVKLIYSGLRALGSVSGMEPTGAIAGFFAALRGLGQLITLQGTLPIGTGNWYWDPTRIILLGTPASPITEFPFFTFLYADLHAHMIALPLTVTGIGWALSMLLHAEKRFKPGRINTVLAFFIGALILGSLRPTNTWDLPVYLVLGALAAGGSVWIRARKTTTKVLGRAVLAALIVVVLALLLYQPFATWYGQGYSAVDPWEFEKTPVGEYLTVHGLFLFILATWMMWETRQWMAATPASALHAFRRYAVALFMLALVLLLGLSMLLNEGIGITLVALPMGLWAGLLLLRRGMPLEKRIVLFLSAVALGLTFVVEVVVLRGDIGRMNTVFKFYLQVWTMFSVTAGAALAWMVSQLPLWNAGWRRLWTAMLALLVFGAAMYPLTAAPAKMRDRMSFDAPTTLDGMAYMPLASYHDLGEGFDLDEDYRAIRWMQENVQGSPVIVEAHTVEYRWGSRFSIYTGLPTVLGWNWHQRQQRVVTGDTAIMQRASDIAAFYMTRSVEDATEFLETYDVRYVMIGQMERLYYEEMWPCWAATPDGATITCEMAGRPLGMEPPDVPASECQPFDPQHDDGRLRCPSHAFEKFEVMIAEGLLREAYRDGDTIIYEVLL